MFNYQITRKRRLRQSLYRELVAFWPMSEPSGDRADKTANALTLTNNNSVGSAAGVGISTASSFSGTQSLSRASESLIQLGDFDFTYAGWVYSGDVASGYPPVLTKYSATQQQIYLYFEPTQLRWVVSPVANGTGSGGVTSAGTQANNTWYFVTVWHDSVNNQIGIAVDNGAASTTSYSSGVYSSGTVALRFGLDESGAPSLNGRLQRWGFWKRVLTAADRLLLYNNGNGLAYPFTGQNI